MSKTIEPTVGRIVWYRDTDGATRAAIVVGVNSKFNVNLFVFGYSSSDLIGGMKDSVTHADPAIEPRCLPSWDWMPYQKQQVEKHTSEAVRADAPKTSAMPTSDLTFGSALNALKAGKRVARAGWNGSGQWVALGKGADHLDASQFWNEHARAHAEQNGGGATVRPYFILKTAQNDILMGWSPSQSDALAEDWEIVD